MSSFLYYWHSLQTSDIVRTIIMKKIFTLYSIVFLTAITYVAFFPVTVHASGGCTALYNGGITTQQHCYTPTPTPALASHQIIAVPTKAPSKTDQPVFPSSKAKTTPNTGPADWALLALFIIGGIGLFLIKKTYIWIDLLIWIYLY